MKYTISCDVKDLESLKSYTVTATVNAPNLKAAVRIFEHGE